MADPILTELHDRLIGLTAKGNLRLDTSGKCSDNSSRIGFPHLVGDSIPSQILITNAKGGSANICLVSFQLADSSGVAVAFIQPIDVYLSDTAATGIGLTAHTASGAVAAGTSGTVTGILTASKAFRGITDATGLFILSITDSGKNLFVPVGITGNLATFVGAALTTGSYD